jgi:hypothetical protein
MIDFFALVNQIPPDKLLYGIIGLHCLIGLLATGVAYYKGRNLKLWLLIGLTCGTAALFVALAMKRARLTSPKTGVE